MFLKKLSGVLASLALALVLMSSYSSVARAECVHQCWGALAAGTWQDASGGAHVAIGSAYNYETAAIARREARKECRRRGINCRVVGTFSNGACGYITVGQTSDGVAWYSGPSYSDVLRKCQRAGYGCKEPIGGCTEDR